MIGQLSRRLFANMYTREYDIQDKTKYVGRCASLIQNIYVMADPTPVDAHHAVHACRCIGRPQCLFSES